MGFGGLKKSLVERLWLNFFWKSYIKKLGPIYAALWTVQVIFHRDYDTNAYAYFYFSD